MSRRPYPPRTSGVRAEGEHLPIRVGDGYNAPLPRVEQRPAERGDGTTESTSQAMREYRAVLQRG